MMVVSLFGLPESGSIVDDKAIVDEAFEFLVGNSVTVKDMFRLGTSPLVLPVLVKYRSAQFL